MSRANRGVFPSLVGGHSDRPAPEALRAIAPTSVRATAPPMTPTVRGLRFPRRHSSSPYRCARQSPSFATRRACQSASFATRRARRSASRAAGSAGRRVSRIARSASCTGPGWEGLLIGRGQLGIPESRKMDCSYSSDLRKNSGLQLAGGERKPSKDREIGVRAALPPPSLRDQSINSQSHGESRQKLHLPHELARWGTKRGRFGQCARKIRGFDSMPSNARRAAPQLRPRGAKSDVQEGTSHCGGALRLRSGQATRPKQSLSSPLDCFGGLRPLAMTKP